MAALTADRAFAIKARLHTVRMALVAAIEIILECDRTQDVIRADLELHQALRHTAMAAGIVANEEAASDA